VLEQLAYSVGDVKGCGAHCAASLMHRIATDANIRFTVSSADLLANVLCATNLFVTLAIQ